MRKVSWSVPMRIIGKPRMTQRDKWKKRPPVIAYRAWADEFRMRAPKNIPQRPRIIEAHALVPMPQSWTKKKRAEKHGVLHDEKPDVDNWIKSICDILFYEDKTIGYIVAKAYWIMPNDTPRLKITITGEDE